MLSVLPGQFSNVFPFRGCGDRLELDEICPLRPDNIPFTVKVVRITASGWRFDTKFPHVLGPGAYVEFRFFKKAGRIYLQIHGVVPEALTWPDTAWEVYSEITRVQWQTFQTNLQDALAIKARPPKVGRTISIESSNFQGQYLRHRNGLAELTGLQSDLDFADSSFIVVKGLAGSGISLRSVNYPAYYLRHENFRLKLGRGKSELFKRDATFTLKQGLDDRYGWSLRSYNYRQRFIRHYNGHFYVTDQNHWPGTPWKSDATFYLFQQSVWV